MELLSVNELAEDLNKNNTFIVEGQLCLGEVITASYKENGIMVLADYNHLKWIVRGWEIEHVTKIIKESGNNLNQYRIIFDNLPPRNITGCNRKELKSIPAEDCGTDFLKLLDKDIFDDSISFLIYDDCSTVAVIGLDLRRLCLNEKQKQKISDEMRNPIKCFDVSDKSSAKKEPSETLCLVVETDDYNFSFQGLDVNSFEVKPLRISVDLHKHNKVEEYTQKMVNNYNLAYQNIQKHTEPMKELCELIETLR